MTDLDLTIRRGDDYLTSRRLVVAVVDSLAAAVDLTGTTLRFMVKRRKSDADSAALISKSTTSGIALAAPQSGATKGVAYISIAAADTDDLRAGQWFCELEATDSVGIITLAEGSFTILADLIRDT